MLWQKCKKFWFSKYIHTFWVSNGILRLKLITSCGLHVTSNSQDVDEVVSENELLKDEQ